MLGGGQSNGREEDSGARGQRRMEKWEKRRATTSYAINKNFGCSRAGAACKAICRRWLMAKPRDVFGVKTGLGVKTERRHGAFPIANGGR